MDGKKLNINTDKIAIIILFVMTAMQLSITKVLAPIIPIFNLSYNPPILCVLYILMIGAIMVLVVGPRIIENKRIKLDVVKEYKELIILMGILLIAIISTDIITIAKGQLRITNVLTHNLDYFYAFLALPIVIILKEGKISLEKLTDVLLSLTIVSMLIRLYAVIYYAITEVEILCLTRESTGDWWYRNGRIRVMAPCLIILCVPLSVYMFMYTKSLAKKIFYAFACFSCFFFAWYVWQSRAGLIVFMGGVAVMILFRKMSPKAFYITWGAVCVLLLLFVMFGGVGKVMASFSISDDAIYGGENRGHLYAYQLFFGRFLASPFGEGLSETLAEWFPNGRAMWMCDAGLLYSLVPMGILIGIFLIGMFARGIKLYFKTKKLEWGCLILSITLMFAVNEFVADFFFTPLAFTVPFFWGIVEYLARKEECSAEDLVK